MNKTILLGLLIFSASSLAAAPGPLQLNDNEYFETRGVNILVFSNWYNGLFDDSKMSGIELIQQGVRTATNGDVRLNATPEQWDAIPEFVDRVVDKEKGVIQANLRYAQYDFDFSIRAEAAGDAVLISVHLPRPLPAELAGKAGFNLEFLPAAYFGKSFLMDESTGVFPLYPVGPKEQNDRVAPTPLATGNRLILAPDDSARTVTIHSPGAVLNLYDGRSKAQNGWYVVRSLLPAGKSGQVLQWTLSAQSQADWVRPPVIAHSQVGYHPQQRKTAVIELDPNDKTEAQARLYRVDAQGGSSQVLAAVPADWGRYQRYNYRTFDFSEITEEGIYYIEYAGQKTAPFRIAGNVYENIWYPTLDIYLPVQMDHVMVNEAYRVWHGASHLDDALQAPVNHEHFDLYAQGPTTDSPYQPGEHIPGLNIGGWYDAGDYDIRTQTQYAVVINLVNTWENFHPDRDTTSVDYPRKYVDIHVPDGKPDLLQQIEHGTLALVAQFRAVGHAIPGIIVPDLSQYTHLGDGLTMTDNLVYDAQMGELETDGFKSGVFDDRWAFTSFSSTLNYGSTAALAAASRALRGYNDELADESLQTAIKAWDEEQSRDPIIFKHGNTTGGSLPVEQLNAALELLVATGEQRYADAFLQNLPEIEAMFPQLAIQAVRAMPYMDEPYREKIKQLTLAYREQMDEVSGKNPFGVLITEGGWAGNGTIIGIAMGNYYLHKAFPGIIQQEDVLQGLNYILGTHPGSDISFVSAVGTQSKKVAYGMNRADFSFIAGGVVPGVLILKPDFPENKEDWPFLWGENEYVVNVGATYIFLANAANELVSKVSD
ncbi:glycoside hydrolase family 9 protein [Pseudomonadota bacterium]